jgi:nitrite reductase/ring-hydroxylating ferredoxin subunit
MSFIKVAQVDQIPEGAMKSITIKGESILVAYVEGHYYAIEDACTHAGAGLSKGTLEGKIVTCPRASSQFDVTNGARVRGPAMQRVKTYPVIIEGRNIKVEI